jgi:hypothetical protein
MFQQIRMLAYEYIATLQTTQITLQRFILQLPVDLKMWEPWVCKKGVEVQRGRECTGYQIAMTKPDLRNCNNRASVYVYHLELKQVCQKPEGKASRQNRHSCFQLVQDDSL